MKKWKRRCAARSRHPSVPCWTWRVPYGKVHVMIDGNYSSVGYVIGLSCETREMMVHSEITRHIKWTNIS